MNSRKESLMYFVAMLMSLLATSAAWASQSIDAVREALADEIAANVGAATENAARLREKALKIRVEAAKVRTGEWYEVWPGVNGMVTNRVAGEIWNDAIQAAIDAHGAVYVPAAVFSPLDLSIRREQPHASASARYQGLRRTPLQARPADVKSATGGCRQCSDGQHYCFRHFFHYYFSV